MTVGDAMVRRRRPAAAGCQSTAARPRGPGGARASPHVTLVHLAARPLGSIAGRRLPARPWATQIWARVLSFGRAPSRAGGASGAAIAFCACARARMRSPWGRWPPTPPTARGTDDWARGPPAPAARAPAAGKQITARRRGRGAAASLPAASGVRLPILYLYICCVCPAAGGTRCGRRGC
ncbi:unnamed protein product [Urochloa humidicola]